MNVHTAHNFSMNKKKNLHKKIRWISTDALIAPFSYHKLVRSNQQVVRVGWNYFLLLAYLLFQNSATIL